MNLDFYLFQQINGLAGQYFWLDSTAIFLAKYFSYILGAAVFSLLLINKRKYLRMVVLGMLSGILARFGVVELIRFFFPGGRPFIENHVNLLIDKVDQQSFPSGHAAFFFALSTIVYFYNKKAGLLFFLASFLISISRVFVGIHWPLDIVAGAVVGVLVGTLVLKAYFQTDYFKWLKL
jgi:undecaprenyl-diphosphatase